MIAMGGYVTCVRQAMQDQIVCRIAYIVQIRQRVVMVMHKPNLCMVFLIFHAFVIPDGQMMEWVGFVIIVM